MAGIGYLGQLPDPFDSLSVSPDGTSLSAQSMASLVWDLGSGLVTRLVTGNEHLEFAPHGDLLASSGASRCALIHSYDRSVAMLPQDRCSRGRPASHPMAAGSRPAPRCWT